jgi:hypothetical protein
VAGLAFPAAVRAGDCEEEAPLQNYTGGGTVVCPCFVAGEEAGAVLTAPPAHYPIEILRVGIGWGSVFGGNPQSLEQAVHIYGTGLPNPGTPIATMEGPLLTDGFINEFNFEPLAGEVIDNAGPFTVTLEFMNANAGNQFAPSVVHDGNGCQGGKNVVFAIPGGWFNACALGVTGDWVFYAIYRQVNCATGVGEEFIVSTGSLESFPNPFQNTTQIRFDLARSDDVELAVYDVTGRRIRTLLSRQLSPGAQASAWDARDDAGRSVAPGTYFLRLTSASGDAATERVTVVR